jgi:S-adenosylmethionine decarboxylase
MTQFSQSNSFECFGQHLLLNLADCQIDLDDIDLVKRDFIVALDAIGAHILGQLEHKFQPCGVSIVLLLSESHASIHTYPEYRACFIDLFTCGRQIRIDPFVNMLAELWRPQRIHKELHERRQA